MVIIVQVTYTLLKVEKEAMMFVVQLFEHEQQWPIGDQWPE
jgi:hypothetical protein